MTIIPLAFLTTIKNYRFIGRVVTLIVLGLTDPIGAVVNTEVLRTTTTANSLAQAFSLTYENEQGNTQARSTGISYRANLSLETSTAFFVFGYNESFGASRKVKDQLFAHLRGALPWWGSHRLETFTQHESDSFKSLNARNLVGVSLRTPLIVDGSSLYMGNGLMHEAENYSGGTNNETTIRGSHYVSGTLRISPETKLLGVVYYQPKLSDFSDYRILSENSISFSVLSNLKFDILLVYKFDSAPISGVKKTDLSFSNVFTFFM